jgi:hypothetical protein
MIETEIVAGIAGISVAALLARDDRPELLEWGAAA